MNQRQSTQTDLNKALISGMEVDLSQNGALFYCSPDILKNINNLKNLKIYLQTKGYETFKGDNIVINIGIIGKISNKYGMRYKINTQKIIDNLASKVIKMIEPKTIDPEENVGLEWNLGAFTQYDNRIIVPEQSFLYENADGQYSLRFSSYKGKEVNQNLEEDSDDDTVEYAKMNKEIIEESVEPFTQPICDTDSDDDNELIDDLEQLSLEYALGYSLFKEEELGIVAEIEDAGLKISECTPKSLSEIIQRKFNEHDIEDQVNDMLLELIYQGKVTRKHMKC